MLFAIESYYRMRNIVKLRTSTRNITFRYFFALVSFLLRSMALPSEKTFYDNKTSSPDH